MSGKLTIQIVGWNSAEDLAQTLPTQKDVPEDDVVWRYLDNNSSDDSIDLVREMLPAADIIELTENKGFTGAHNIGFSLCETELVMVYNPDFIMHWLGVKQLLKAFNNHKVAAVQGKIYRGRRDSHKESLPIIDSAGIEMSWSLNGYDRGAGEADRGQYDTPKAVAAVSGAAGIYRMKALRAVAHNEQEIFDNDFFAYKDEVDLGWRLRKAGWQCLYLPTKEGWHERVIKKYRIRDWRKNPELLLNKLRDKRTEYSVKNWIWMIVKNVELKDAIKHEIFVDARLLVLFGIGLFYWPIMSALWKATRGIPKMAAKRRR